MLIIIIIYFVLPEKGFLLNLRTKQFLYVVETIATNTKMSIAGQLEIIYVWNNVDYENGNILFAGMFDVYIWTMSYLT